MYPIPSFRKVFIEPHHYSSEKRTVFQSRSKCLALQLMHACIVVIKIPG